MPPENNFEYFMFPIYFLLLLEFLILKVTDPSQRLFFPLKKSCIYKEIKYKMTCEDMQSSRCCFTIYSLFTDVVCACSSFEWHNIIFNRGTLCFVVLEFCYFKECLYSHCCRTQLERSFVSNVHGLLIGRQDNRSHVWN